MSDEFPYELMVFDISGVCNASCPWCDYGARRTGFLPDPPVSRDNSRPFATPDICLKTLNHLFAQGLISKKSVVCLYNWGEPFLNPHLEEILRIFRRFGLLCELSTNASVVKVFSSAQALANVYNIKVSMPGFSQNSYDLAHGFNFERIKANIARNAVIWRNAGLKGTVTIVGHLYRHNLREMGELVHFAKDLKVNVSLVPAYMSSLDFLFGYAKHELAEEILDRAERDLFLPERILLERRPEGYTCPQWDILSLDWQGRLSLGCCCRTSRADEISMAPLDGLSPGETRSLRVRHAACKTCISLGIDYYLHNTEKFVNIESRV